MGHGMTLDGRTAFISGGGRNIGRAIALELADAGCDIVINGRQDRATCDEVAGEVAARGRQALVQMGDIGDSAGVRSMAKAALERFGRIDILVNNAAIRPEKPFLEMTDEDWHGVLDVDLHSAFYTCHALLPGMVEGNWGRVINITGMNAIHGYSGRAPVSAAKHGLWGLTKALAKEFGPAGVTTNAISPGPIATEHKDAHMARHIEEHRPHVPLRRLGEPEEIAGLVGYLCGGSGGFVNGQMFAVNGGMQT